jgi:transposase
MAMTTVAENSGRVTVGIDTHADVNVAAALDERGRLLDTGSFPTTATGHRHLERWALELGPIEAVGIEGTGAWGAGIARHLAAEGHRIVEVDRPDRKTRRRRGKSDAIDAEAAARAVQAGTANGTPKSRTGLVESIRALRVARRSAIRDRSSAIHQIHSLVSTAPDTLRAELDVLSNRDLVATCAAFRPGDLADPFQATKAALRSIARRHRHLTEEITDLDAHLEALVTTAAPPSLLARHGIGIDVAGQLLVTAGDNPDRLHSSAAFARLCGVAPVPASSGRTDRHRLDRGGDRAANAAIYRIALSRLRWDQRTRDYIHRRMTHPTHPKTKKEAIRCLKHYIAREIYNDLRHLSLDNP